MSKQTFEDVNIEITFRENAGDMNAVEMLRAYATLLVEKENNEITHWNGTTHYAGCIQAGPKHYECALQEVGRLRNTITDLREQLKDCSAAFDRQQEQLDRNAEQLAALRGQLQKETQRRFDGNEIASKEHREEVAALQEQNKWLLHELKDAANRLTALGETTLSVRDCIKNIEEQEK
jgi:predicted  nucleic acid-binding Zn-ribbon protein